MSQEKMRLLFVEDDVGLLNSLSYILESDAIEVLGFPRGEEALSFCRQADKPIDFLLLDWSLPDISIEKLVTSLRTAPLVRKKAPLVILTGHSEESNIVKGLEEFMADDYIVKPVRPKILLARIHAVLRRSSSLQVEETTSEKDDLLELNDRSFEAFLRGELLALTKSEFLLLQFFHKNKDMVFSRSDIIRSIWGPDYHIAERSLDFQICSLRKKMGESGKAIETVRGVGFRFRPFNLIED